MHILEMSLSAGILILIIVIFRTLALNKVPKVMFLSLWCVTLVRLLVPVALPSQFNIYSIIQKLRASNPSSVLTSISGIPDITTTTELTREITNFVPFVHEPKLSFNLFTLIWLVGVLFMFAYFTFLYYLNSRRLLHALPITNSDFMTRWLEEHPLKRSIKILRLDRLQSPIAVGVLHPRIILPESIDMENEHGLRFILEHEYFHIRHLDMIVKLLMVLALCIHWFNPLVWVMFILLIRDLELACDESVIYHFGQDTRSEYAYTLIHMAEKNRVFAPFSNAFSKKPIEERIISIMKTKKNSKLTIALASLFVLTITIVFATTEDKVKAQDILNNDSNPSTSITYSYKGDNDAISYRVDDGPWLNEEEYLAQNAVPDVEWWTYDDYKDWLDNEKLALQNILGEKSFSEAEGWYTWTQDRIDNAITLYEENLQQIKDGVLISKRVGHDDNIMLSYTASPISTEVDDSYNITLSLDNGEFITFGPYNTKEELLEKLTPYVDKQVKDGNITPEDGKKILKLQ